MSDNFLYTVGDRVWYNGSLCEIIAVCADEESDIFFELLRLEDDATFLADAFMFHRYIPTSYPVEMEALS